jgi:hypothetical protein
VFAFRSGLPVTLVLAFPFALTFAFGEGFFSASGSDSRLMTGIRVLILIARVFVVCVISGALLSPFALARLISTATSLADTYSDARRPVFESKRYRALLPQLRARRAYAKIQTSLPRLSVRPQSDLTDDVRHTRF